MAQALVGSQTQEAGPGGAGGRVIAVAGAKGGLGTTIIATHLAWDVVRQARGMRVCLVDLDVEKGDVPSYLDVSHRVSVADLAKISEDLTSRAVADTVVVHSSGLHLLLAPTEIRETEVITPAAVRQIVAQLRRLYQLVIIDTGSSVTATQAAAVESSDQTLQIVSADVPALRSARRQVVFWESLGVVNPDDVRVVVNRFQRRGEIQQDTIDMLILGERSEVLIPDLERGLERAGNSRTPSEVRNGAWWKSLRRIGQELRVMSQFHPDRPVNGNGRPPQDILAQPDLASGPATSPVAAPGAVPAAVRRQPESGQIALENVLLIPVALLLLIFCLQLALFGLGFVSAGSAADAAARAASIGADPEAAALAAVPEQLAGGIGVEQEGNQVTVRFTSPLLFLDGVTRTATMAVDHRIVEEPR